ncbi:sulfatase family protein [Echinicola vietnamensis]|uniref:Arylsulfatase A family protein n=1 Tax=Echinicola vietnamensis (strain DSM 17526 / LMG 23754 / KMM 6221) TaxID=926556 RepID=L0FVI3_ECHVK|nr:sulfatase-like hydrolase/transferase [Echinicola vietnamensis]AGA77322.1 arylsulfatase A family protein [Echinicola vietnamensis DSM 17526]
MKYLILACIVLVLGSCGESSSQVSQKSSSAKPNIIIIYTDDMGIGDLSCYNSGWVTTPNIDKLAANGLKFNHYYSAAPVCSPSRVGITTGMYPTEWGINTFLHSRKGNANCEQFDFLDPKAPSMARVLKTAGYQTSHIGKWHMGGGRDVDDAPQITEYGFDEYTTTYEGPDPDKLITASNWIWSEQDSIERWERTGYFVDKTLDFLKRHQDQPCFVNFWPDDMHDPWIPNEEFYDQRDTWPSKPNFIPVLKEYDRQIGRLMAGLEELGIAENTMIIFTSDNGAYPTYEHIRTNSQRGAKNSLYEGGIRMPFIVSWPAAIKANQTDNETIIAAVDLLPSLASLTGAELPKEYALAGQDMSQALVGKNPQARKNDLFWDFGRNEHFNRPRQPYHQSPHLAVRHENWKLLVNSDSSRVELYDLEKDVNETTNIAEQHPALAGKLSHEVIQWYWNKRKIRKD